jgi:hypothetical protein
MLDSLNLGCQLFRDLVWGFGVNGMLQSSCEGKKSHGKLSLSVPKSSLWEKGKSPVPFLPATQYGF